MISEMLSRISRDSSYMELELTEPEADLRVGTEANYCPNNGYKISEFCSHLPASVTTSVLFGLYDILEMVAFLSYPQLNGMTSV